jgi:hypothetical protein
MLSAIAARDLVEVPGGTLDGEQLELVPQADAVRLGEADVWRLAPLGGETAEGLSADPASGGEVDDWLQGDSRAAGVHQRGQPGLDLRTPGSLDDTGLDDHRGSVREDVHQ